MNKKFNSLVFHHVSMNVSNYDDCLNYYLGLGMNVYCEWAWDEDICDGDGKVFYHKGDRSCFIDVGSGPAIELNEIREKNKENGLLEHFCLSFDTKPEVNEVYNAAIELGAKPIAEPADQQLMCKPKPILESRVAHVIGLAGEHIEIISWSGYNPYN